MIYDFEIYTGKSANTSTDLGITGDLVMRLCERIPKNKNYKVHFDKFFTSLGLLEQLKSNGIQAMGAIRQNGVEGAKKLLLSEKELKSKGRGSYDWRVDASR